MKNMIFGRFMGFIFLFIGVLFGLLGFLVMLETESVFGFMMATPTLLLLGLAMIIFPGVSETLHEVNGDESFMELLKDRNKRDERNARQMACLAKAPLLHKIMWIIFSAVGIGATIVFVIKYTV